jgi:hypothetical protein
VILWAGHGGRRRRRARHDGAAQRGHRWSAAQAALRVRQGLPQGGGLPFLPYAGTNLTEIYLYMYVAHVLVIVAYDNEVKRLR